MKNIVTVSPNIVNPQTATVVFGLNTIFKFVGVSIAKTEFVALITNVSTASNKRNEPFRALIFSITSIALSVKYVIVSVNSKFEAVTLVLSVNFFFTFPLKVVH